MTVETATKIYQLNPLLPPGTDPKSEGDDHLRLIKSVLTTTFNDAGSGGMNMGTVAQAGQLFGLVVSNDATDATNSIDVAPGSAASDDAVPWMINLASTMVKKTNAAWAAGSGVGGFDGGVMPANSTGHVFLIGKSTDVTAADIFISANLAPTLPSGFDRKRRIMSIMRDTTQIRQFRQLAGGRIFLLAPVSIRSGTAAATDVLVTCTVPAGIRVRPILQMNMVCSVSSTATNIAADGDMASTSGINIVQQVIAGTGGTSGDVTFIDHLFTNTAQQIRWSTSISGGTITTNNLNSAGWWDDRGMF